MSILRSVVFPGLAHEAVLSPLRKAIVRGRPMVLMYHELARDSVDVDAWTIVRESDFVSQVEYLRAHYRIVSLDELMTPAVWQADGKPAVTLTFDDGDAGNFEVLLPLVERLQLPVSIFIATGHIVTGAGYWFDRVVNALQVSTPTELDLRDVRLDVYRVNSARGSQNWLEIQRLLTDIKQLPPDRSDAVADRIEALSGANREPHCGRILPLTVEQTRALGRSRYITIGAHSHCHRLLTQLSLDEARASIEESRTRLREWTGQEVGYFAYPSGAHNDAVVKLVEELGFRAAFTTVERFWDPGESHFSIPRMGVGRYDTLDQFKLNLLGGVRALGSSLKQSLLAQGTSSSGDV